MTPATAASFDGLRMSGNQSGRLLCTGPANDIRLLRTRTSVPYTIPYQSGAKPKATAQRPTPTVEYRVHRGSGNTANRCHRTWQHVGSHAPLAIAKAGLFPGTAWTSTAGVTTAARGWFKHDELSARANLGHQFANTLSGRSADNLNPRTRNPTNQSANRPTQRKEENRNQHPNETVRFVEKSSRLPTSES